MALNVRRLAARFVIMVAVTLAVVVVVSKLEGTGGPKEITVVVDLGAVAGLRSTEVELRTGKDRRVVAHAERQGPGGSIRLQAPALGPDGEVRVMLDTDDGVRRIRRPLTAAAGSEVVIRAGVEE